MTVVAELQTRVAATAAAAAAPDGSEVRLLCGTIPRQYGAVHPPPGAVARAATHRSVDEIWYVLAGQGGIWRRLAEREETIALTPGVSLNLPVGTWFQFRSDGTVPLVVLGVTMPPLRGEQEAVIVPGAWEPTEG
ncbi:MAG: cupin domain-containing protein [Rhodospirillales bacterium]|nr:cupin domain-containing protein [Rhodospirillales bacterium]